MASSYRAHEVTVGWLDPRSAYWTTHFLKKLLIERHAIRAALEHPGGSVITSGSAQAADAANLPSYSSVIGNDFHLDLLEAEKEVNTLALRDRIELLAWCDGLSPREAATWANLRGGKLRSTKPSAVYSRVEDNMHKVAEGVQGHEVSV